MAKKKVKNSQMIIRLNDNPINQDRGLFHWKRIMRNLGLKGKFK